MNLNELLTFIKQITEPEIAEQVLKIVDDAADVYVDPLCKVFARSTSKMYLELNKYFPHEDAMRILVAMVGKGKGGN
jgi:hypothetical protein